VDVAVAAFRIFTVSVVEALSDPEVPVMVTVALPIAAELLAERESALAPADSGFGENVAVTPLGRPVAARLTLPANPFCGIISTVAAPEPPGVRSTSPGAVAMEKLGVLMVRLNVVELVVDPDTPVRVTTTGPGIALATAARVSVLELVVGLGEKEAVTPLGRPDADRVTLLENPYCGETVTVPVVELPGLRLTPYRFE
jgi:hypothetical protein